MAEAIIPTIPPARLDGCSLYRYFDKDGHLLYVGISASAARRLSEHVTGPWADKIASVTVQTYPDRQAAADAERVAIREENPAYNVMHKRVVRPFDDVIPEGAVMTDAERQRRRYARRKAGLVRVEAWVPVAAEAAVREAIERAVRSHALAKMARLEAEAGRIEDAPKVAQAQEKR